MKNILAFDTSTPACSVALRYRGELFVHHEIAHQRAAEVILPAIKELLAKAKASLADLDVIAYGQGPGSFIGVRIAAGIAQSLSYVHDLPVVAVSTLQTVAQAAFEQTAQEKILAGWDARMEAIYWGTFCADNQLMQATTEELLSAPNEIKFPKDHFLAAGNAWPTYFPERESLLIYPQASAMITLVQHKLQSESPLKPFAAQPVYLRDHIAKKPQQK